MQHHKAIVNILQSILERSEDFLPEKCLSKEISFIGRKVSEARIDIPVQIILQPSVKAYNLFLRKVAL